MLKPAFTFAARLFAHEVGSHRQAAANKGLRKDHKFAKEIIYEKVKDCSLSELRQAFKQRFCLEKNNYRLKLSPQLQLA